VDSKAEKEAAIDFVNTELWRIEGRHLNSAEITVFSGTWDRLSYVEMADQSHYSVDTLRATIGYSLWRLLEKVLEVPISKKNLQLQILQLQQKRLSGETIGNVASTRQPLMIGQHPYTSVFYGREKEKKLLTDAITQKQIILLVGHPGVGKSSLASEAALASEFAYVLWESIHYAPSLSSLVRNLLNHFNHKTSDLLEENISNLINFLKSHKCLVILDAAESLLRQDGRSLNPYAEGYADYGKFWRRLSESSLKSCVVLTSQRPFNDLVRLSNGNKSVQVIKLEGLPINDAKKILDDHRLRGNQYEKLIQTYRGNPLILLLVSSTIRDFFGGDIDKFLSHNTVLMSDVIKEILDQQFRSLSSLDKKVLRTLSNSSEAIDFSTLLGLMKQADTSVTVSDIVQSVESLDERSLIERRSSSTFSVQPLIAKYCKNRSVDNESTK